MMISTVHAAPKTWAELVAAGVVPSPREAPVLDAVRARELLDYDPETGAMTWIKTQRAGTSTNGFDKGTGYRGICVDGRLYQFHRVVWLWCTGQWPSEFIDHINGVKHDNRIANLRDVSRSMNGQNRVKTRRGAKSGALGVVWCKGKWQARITVDGKFKNLGRFNSVAEASAAYFHAKAQLHPGFVPERLQEQTQ